MPGADVSRRDVNDMIPEKIVEEEAGEFKQRQRRRSSISQPLLANVRRGSYISNDSCTYRILDRSRLVPQCVFFPFKRQCVCRNVMVHFDLVPSARECKRFTSSVQKESCFLFCVINLAEGDMRQEWKA